MPWRDPCQPTENFISQSSTLWLTAPIKPISRLSILSYLLGGPSIVGLAETPIEADSNAISRQCVRMQSIEERLQRLQERLDGKLLECRELLIENKALRRRAELYIQQRDAAALQRQEAEQEDERNEALMRAKGKQKAFVG